MGEFALLLLLHFFLLHACLLLRLCVVLCFLFCVRVCMQLQLKLQLKLHRLPLGVASTRGNVTALHFFAAAATSAAVFV